jgi:polyferredoxin
MGTIQDITSQRSLFQIKWKNPIIWTRILNICAFFTTAFIFFFIRLDSGMISGIKFEPWFLNMDFNIHYKHIWLYDTLGAVLLGLLLERRWACRNLCFMGALCATGASISRLIPVVDFEKCNLCGKCETDCLIRIPIRNYVTHNNGLVTNSECLICGKCIESCKPKALKLKFIWNRNKYIQKHSGRKSQSHSFRLISEKP